MPLVKWRCCSVIRGRSVWNHAVCRMELGPLVATCVEVGVTYAWPSHAPCVNYHSFSFFLNCNAINTSIGYVCAGCGVSIGFKVKHWYEVLKPYSVGSGKVLSMLRQL